MYGVVNIRWRALLATGLFFSQALRLMLTTPALSLCTRLRDIKHGVRPAEVQHSTMKKIKNKKCRSSLSPVALQSSASCNIWTSDGLTKKKKKLVFSFTARYFSSEGKKVKSLLVFLSLFVFVFIVFFKDAAWASICWGIRRGRRS